MSVLHPFYKDGFRSGVAEGRRLERQTLLMEARRNALDAHVHNITSGKWVSLAVLSARSKRKAKGGGDDAVDFSALRHENNRLMLMLDEVKTSERALQAELQAARDELRLASPPFATAQAEIERLKGERLAWQGAGHGPWREAEAERKEEKR